MRRLVTCPNYGRLVSIEYHEDPIDGHILGIVRCSLFQPAEDVDCEQTCATRLNRRQSRQKSEP